MYRAQTTGIMSANRFMFRKQKFYSA